MSEKTGGAACRGELTIFFSYTPEAGAAGAMVQAAQEAAACGRDVVAGCPVIQTGGSTGKWTDAVDSLPPLPDGEFDLDGAILRKPQILILADLAHRNGPSCRHVRRFQDVEELLTAGIHVYTTANVGNIESLGDMVASITGTMEEERIPDSLFDGADQVLLVDREPRRLLESERGNGLSLEDLTALRELALRRCADRIGQQDRRARQKSGEHRTEEHVLVCLSASPTNPRIIRTAARMVKAFRGTFTALFVETPGFRQETEENRRRLQANMRLARQLGAAIETVYGEDVPFQIAEFARISGVSRIVMGRSTARRRLLGPPPLTDRVIALTPNLDIHIIPDALSGGRRPFFRRREGKFLSLRDLLVCAALLLLATAVGLGFAALGMTEADVIMVYLLGVVTAAALTSSWACSLLMSVVSILVFNFFFTEPRFTLHAYDASYPLTFLVVFVAALLTGSLAARLKSQAQQAAQAAYRMKILLDTSQLLQRAGDREEILSVTASQLTKLLGRDLVAYLPLEDGLDTPRLFPAGASPSAEWPEGGERMVAEWVLKNNRHAGATTDTFSEARCLYLAIRAGSQVYGVVGILIGERGLDAFENSVLLSILGECALALENSRNLAEKEAAAVLAKNEQLRADLLRTISHDLRTPLTSISGNASNLLSNGDTFDRDTRTQIYQDIYEDSLWLISLVENLLSVSRIEGGRMNLRMSTELMDEVVAEALRHVRGVEEGHAIAVTTSEEYLLVRVDARLIVQVVINIVDNAVRYTPAGSLITLSTLRQGDMVLVRIADTGPGIPDEIKGRIFDMFFTGGHQVADSRRSLGLGLALCRSIVNAHGGQIWVEDNQPHGAVFAFTLPAGEVTLHE